MYDDHDDKAKEDGDKLEETRELFLSLSVENLEHDHVEQSSRRQALQGVHHQVGHPGPDLGDDDPPGDTQGAGEAEHHQVGEEDEPLGAGL